MELVEDLDLLHFQLLGRGWIWLPAATCSWDEPRGSNAELLCSSGSAGSTRTAPRWTPRNRSSATTPAAGAVDAAADASKGTRLSLSICSQHAGCSNAHCQL